ncbi:17030_t:CDS:2 [Acaulospora morrowiae]|uniref:17030_t:CDS:1 n=1 Tax=Acaulospora morrowiae TaxID=94023 RepID=A0A9N9FIL1_9GLOM|nr:17030_t:CDS:2 [Acaulospora morrowiae]
MDKNEKEALTVKDESSVDEVYPTPQDWNALRKVSDQIPVVVWFIITCELCERFTFYGVSGPFQNYIQFPVPTEVDGQPGAIGAGQQVATSLSLFFQFFCYTTPIMGAIVADKYLGRYKTILIFSLVYVVGLAVLTLTAIPPAISAKLSLPGLLVAMIIIGLGTGGIKPNVSPMSADQYTKTRAFIRTLSSGERVIVDPDITIQSIIHYYYLAINIGSLSVIITTYVEKYHSFWLAYLIPLIVFLFAIAILVIGRNKYVKKEPQGSVIFDFIHVLWIALVNQKNLENAKPSNMTEEQLKRRKVTWGDEFVEQSRIGLRAIKVFTFFPFYWVCYSQIYNNLISQAATMDVGSIPNDVMYNFDTVTLIILTPLANNVLYPTLRRCDVRFGYMARFFLGFMFISAAMFYSAYVQHVIYDASPNLVSVWVQTPSYILVGTSEVLLSITALTYAYQMAPDALESTLTAVYLVTIGLGNLLGFAVVPISKDPYLVIMYSSLGIVAFIVGCLMYWSFGHFDSESEEDEKWKRGEEIITE